MPDAQRLRFGAFELHLSNQRLWRGEQALALTPKAFAVLRYLVERPGQLVTKDALFQAVWPETVVSDAALTVCIRELRQVLGDDSKAPQYIETVHRRGYRFIGQFSHLQGRTTAPPETVHEQRAGGVREVARKLVAILSADVQGYSRLMSADEVATVRTLTAYREVIATLIRRHHGRVVDAPGDNLLAEFGSVVDAVEGAVAMQRALTERNAGLPPERRMAFRMGINVGDVVVEGERIYGEGVNIAARLEGLAEAGGLCISGTVYDQIKTKVALAYEDLGERRVKNIAEPVRVYRVTWGPEGGAVPSPVTSAQQGLPEPQPTARPPGARRRQRPEGTTQVVGREAEVSQLCGYWETALRGDRQIVFVTGEPGIGKTTLVEAFLAQVAALQLSLHSPTPDTQHPTPSSWIGRGQCIEHYGAGEAYLPILEALGRLCREPDGHRFTALLHQHAPTWLVQMPALLSAADLEALQRKTAGGTRERMLRELAEAIEALTVEQPLVLWLEDLHWGDYSTLDWLAFVARRRERARLLVIGTYRLVDVIVKDHPLKGVKQELQLHGQCAELPLGMLSAGAVADYLAARLAAPAPVAAGEACPEQSRRSRGESLSRVPLQRVAQLIHHRTDGNPLFMVNVVEYLIAQGVLVQSEGKWELQRRVEEIAVRIPESLRQLIERQVERLSPEERWVLEVASVAGAEFSAAAVAAGVGTEVEAVEEQCEALARREQFLGAHGTAEWPDGTVAARYGFLHALYQEVLYERLPASRRVKVHRQLGERVEQGYGHQAREVAAELAVHFEQGRDYRKAVQYLQHAGENAARRSAYVEAINHLTTGLELLKTLPDTPERTQQELTLQVTLGVQLIATKGWTAPETEAVYTRARELCRQVGETPQLFLLLVSLWTIDTARAEHKTARELAEQLLRQTQSVHDPIFLVWAHLMLGETLFLLGELAPAREHLEQGIALYDPQKRYSYSTLNDLIAGFI